ncbi:MAG: hypothetical protein M3552_09975 [Planctomycetota bacterium]|nr:hypothetical protein [Planctomycetaceae bacterium]MDQ3330966.1 hypothetical protein [Planctomycetota bacterium]
MQITLPDDQQLRSRAHAAGCATVEEYVLRLVSRDARQDAVREADPRACHEDVTDDEWVKDFRSFLRSLSSRNPRFDDSRESIYPVR